MNDQEADQALARTMRRAANALDRDLRPIGYLMGAPVLLDVTCRVFAEVAVRDAENWLKTQMAVAAPEEPLREAVEAFVKSKEEGYTWTSQWRAYRRMKEAL